MSVKKGIKLLALVGGIAAVNIAVLSPGLLGIRIGGESALQTASGLTLLVVSFLALLYGAYGLLFLSSSAATIAPAARAATKEDYIAALQHYRNAKALKKDIALACEQLERMEKKKHALFRSLAQRFEPAEISYKKFAAAIYEVEKLFYLNIRGVLNKLSVFDASGYGRLAGPENPARLTDKLQKEKSELYREYMTYVAGYLGANEEIMLKLDRLLLEISLLNSADFRDVEEMPGMKEIDRLIKQTPLYKH